MILGDLTCETLPTQTVYLNFVMCFSILEKYNCFDEGLNFYSICTFGVSDFYTFRPWPRMCSVVRRRTLRWSKRTINVLEETANEEIWSQTVGKDATRSVVYQIRDVWYAKDSVEELRRHFAFVSVRCSHPSLHKVIVKWLFLSRHRPTPTGGPVGNDWGPDFVLSRGVLLGRDIYRLTPLPLYLGTIVVKTLGHRVNSFRKFYDV